MTWSRKASCFSRPSYVCIQFSRSSLLRGDSLLRFGGCEDYFNCLKISRNTAAAPAMTKRLRSCL